MSLFPAYSDKPNSEGETLESTDKSKQQNIWLNNESFATVPVKPSSSSESSNPSSDSESPRDEDQKPPRKRSKKRKRDSKNREKERDSEKSLQPFIAPALTPNFDGKEQFYVDKKPERGYHRIQTLHRPACPKYYTSRGLGNYNRNRKKRDSIKRYFSRKFLKKIRDSHSSSVVSSLDSEQFLETNKLLNQATVRDMKSVSAWVDLVRFQDQTPMKGLSKTQLAERKFDILDKALLHNPGNDSLFCLYVEIANQVLPSYEVSKVIEKLLQKDPTNYVLWRGLILATQASMARCIVPDVLKLYERAMQQNYRKRRCDETMMKLFQGCAFFLKQSGLHEQLFALIRLALELNVDTDKFASIKPSEADQNLLIEFEEVVLGSGLPMNEIWLRIEKLRTNFFFLPCPSGFSVSDPQRMVFNEDICHFIYPLNRRENSLKLVFIVLRLLKVPLPGQGFPHSRDNSREESEWDSIEDILPVFMQRSFCNDAAFEGILWALVKDLNHGPSYFLGQIGHEIYTKALLEMLTLLPTCFQGVERMVLTLIWLRFERMLVILAKKDGKLTEEMKKSTKGRFKRFLKLEENRNEINYFVEYALLEYDMGNKEVAVGVLESTYNQGLDSGLSNKDRFYICVTLVEIYLEESRFEEAVKVLQCLGSGSLLGESEEGSDSGKLIALAALRKNLETLSGIEMNVEVMEEEQLHLPDFLVNSLKCLVYMEALVKGKGAAVRAVEDLRGKFGDFKSNSRHSFIREKLWEMQITVKGFVLPKDSMTISWCDFEGALMEYPHNLFLIRRMVNFKGLLWYKLKSLALKTHSSATIIFLIASVRLWFLQASTAEGGEEMSHITMAHKYRVRSLLRDVVNKDERLKKNAILWRLYLRSLFELENSLDQCKNALLSALDECPWNKNLYMDGAVFVPHELTQIQDLIIEKQLRIYALPEELEILRKDS